MMRLVAVTGWLAALSLLAGCQSGTPVEPAQSSATAPPAFAGDDFRAFIVPTGDEASLFDDEPSRRAWQAMQKHIDVEFEGNRLVNVIDYIRKKAGVNVYVNWANLEAAGVEKDTPNTITLNAVTIEQALQLVLKQAGAGAELEPIGYAIRDGVVYIDTQRSLSKTTGMRVYDIRDLVTPMKYALGSSALPEGDITIKLYFPGRVEDEATTLFADDSWEEGPTREERVEELTTLIQDNIGRQDEWAAYGGEVSSLREMDGDLVVRTTPEAHRQLAKMLRTIRASRERAADRIRRHIDSLPKQKLDDLKTLLFRLERKFDGSGELPQPESVEPGIP